MNTYFIIGFSLYLLLFTIINMAGIDNLKKMTDDKDIKELNFNDPMVQLIFALICTIAWPLIIMHLIINYNKQK